MKHLPTPRSGIARLAPGLLAERFQQGRRFSGTLHRRAHQLLLAHQTHESESRDGAEQHLLRCLLLPAVHGLLMVVVVGPGQGQLHIEIR